VDFGEPLGSETQLAHDQRRPPLGENLGRLGDRAKLSVALHGEIPSTREHCSASSFFEPASSFFELEGERRSAGLGGHRLFLKG
jgi:hypothetical protein